MASVVVQTAAEWAGTDAAGITTAGAVEGDYLLESDTHLVKVWADDTVDYDDIAYSYQHYLDPTRVPTVYYRGYIAPSGETDAHYWFGRTAAQLLAEGIEEFDVLYEFDTGQWKVFNGRTDYDDLPYVTQTNAIVNATLGVYSQVKIMNMALGRVGAAPIQSVEDTKSQARIANLYYRLAVADVMGAYDWTSATVRKVLTEADPDDNDVPDNLSGYKYQYRVPTTPRPIRVLHLFVNDEEAYQRRDDPFRLEGDFLYTNMKDAGLVYIGDYSTNTAKLDAFVVHLIVLSLAAKICFSITSSERLTEQIKQEYMTKSAEAQFADSSRSRESTNIDVFPAPEGSWTESY